MFTQGRSRCSESRRKSARHATSCRDAAASRPSPSQRSRPADPQGSALSPSSPRQSPAGAGISVVTPKRQKGESNPRPKPLPRALLRRYFDRNRTGNNLIISQGLYPLSYKVSFGFRRESAHKRPTTLAPGRQSEPAPLIHGKRPNPFGRIRSAYILFCTEIRHCRFGAISSHWMSTSRNAWMTAILVRTCSLSGPVTKEPPFASASGNNS